MAKAIKTTVIMITIQMAAKYELNQKRIVAIAAAAKQRFP